MKPTRKTLTPDDYRAHDSVSNSTLLTVANNPSDVIWALKAPRDVTKSVAADFGTALHTAILEPEKFDDQVYVSSVAGRTTKTFSKEIEDNPDKIVLTESEVQQIKLMQASGIAHPAFNSATSIVNHVESCLFVHDDEFNLDLKIRPDLDSVELDGMLTNLKTTANLDDWRSDRHWINPLFKFNYGHDAAYSLYVASKFYGRELTSYRFAVLQKSVSLGRYPVGVFTITKRELIELGFWEEMLTNLRKFADCYHTDQWLFEESFPMFGDSIEVSEVE